MRTEIWSLKTQSSKLKPQVLPSYWTWLQAWPVQPEDPREYFATIILGSHLERLPEDERMPFVDAVLAQLPEPVIANYVRLNLLARR